MTLPVPVPRTWSVNDLVSAALLNTNIRDAVSFLANPPLFVGAANLSQSIASGVWAGLGLDTNIVDTYNGHSTVTNPVRYTAQVAGWYRCSASITWVANATGSRGTSFGINGPSPIPDCEVFVINLSAGSTPTSTSTRTLFLNVGDWVTALGLQSTAGALSTIAGQSHFEVEWVHA